MHECLLFGNLQAQEALAGNCMILKKQYRALRWVAKGKLVESFLHRLLAQMSFATRRF